MIYKNIEKTPKQRRRETKEKSILEMAMQLILENGLDGFSINKLAENLDYTPGALYRYYNSKDAIIAELEVQVIIDFKNYFLSLKEECHKISTEENASVLIIYFLAELYRAVSKFEPAKYYLITALVADGRILVNDKDAAKVMVEVSALMTEIALVFSEAQEQGILNRGNPVERAIIYLGTIQGVLQLNKLKRLEPSLFEMDSIYSTTIKTLLTGWGLKDSDYNKISMLSGKIDIEKTIINSRSKK